MSDLRTVRWTAIEIAAALLAVALLACVAAPALLAPHDPLAIDPTEAFRAPSAAHPMGTDESGRDVLSRIVFGTRESLLTGLAATAAGLGLGVLLGGLAGGSTRRGLAPLRFAGDRVIEALFAFPGMLLALLIIAIRGPGLASVVIAVALGTAPGYARMVRGGIRAAIGSGPVEAARLQGDGPLRIWSRLILPEAMRPVVALAALGIGHAVILSAALGFLGLGTPPPAPEWGAMLGAGRPYLVRAWWLTLFPGACIMLTGLVATVLGRALDRRGRFR